MPRTKGSKNKPKETSPLAKEAAEMSKKTIDTIVDKPKGPRFISKIIPITPEELSDRVEKQKNIMRANGLAFPKDTIEYPKDWSTMGKIAKLQWLTEHKK